MNLRFQFILIPAIILTDQLIKQAIRALNFKSYVYNSGVSFGLLTSWGNMAIGLLSGILTIFFLYLSVKNNNPVSRFSLCLIIGGSLGNLIDRFTLGGVMDYISIFGLPVFNIADLFVTMGCFMLILNILITGRYDK